MRVRNGAVSAAEVGCGMPRTSGMATGRSERSGKRASGVTIPDPVIASSERFMLETVLRWGVEHFEHVSVHTLVNRVRWSKPERVLNYWQNTTFYDALKRPAFETLLQRHFDEHHQFVNEKWVMMVEMAHARA